MTRTILPSKQLFVSAASALFALLLLCAPGLCQTGENPIHNAGASPAGSEDPAAAASEKAAALWQSSIWEAFPADRLRSIDPDIVSQAYQRNGWKPLFIDSHFELNESAKLVLASLGSLENEAIDPGPYRMDEIAAGIEKLAICREALKSSDLAVSDTGPDELSRPPRAPAPSPADAENPAPAPAQTHPENPVALGERLQKYQDTFGAAAQVDITLSTAFVRFAKEMNPLAGEDPVKALTGEIPMSDMLKTLEPASSRYRVLAASYAHYRALAANVRPQLINFSGPIRPGEAGNHVRDLQKRLNQEGFYSGAQTGVYNTEIQHAVKNFQAAHMLETDGVVGRKTVEWLNVAFPEKVEMIAYAMRTLRQSQTRTHDRFIRINVPQFMLEYHKDGKIQETHRIIVGKAGGKKVKFRGKMVGENNTPTLNSAIEQVILNPRWYVSDRIRLELDSEAKSDPEWFSRHGYVQMSALYPWGQPRIFQRSGPDNALGRVKFEFPNVYAVYLHDTPKKHLFQRTRRDFSHGCIRVDKAIELAQTLLNDDRNPSARKVDSILKNSSQVFVRLSNPVPIAIEYIPVSANEQGQVVFLGDPYGILLTENGGRKG